MKSLIKTTKSIVPYLMIFKLLIKFDSMIGDGDVESNSGTTYHIEKVLQGSFHQSDKRFSTIAGIQYALSWSQIKNVYQWNRLNLDQILTEGDKLYENLRTFHMLSVDDLPRLMVIYECSVQIEFLNLETSVATLENCDPLSRNLVPSNENVFLLFI